jgi:hypothetical protein
LGFLGIPVRPLMVSLEIPLTFARHSDQREESKILAVTDVALP